MVLINVAKINTSDHHQDVLHSTVKHFIPVRREIHVKIIVSRSTASLSDNEGNAIMKPSVAYCTFRTNAWFTNSRQTNS